MRHSSSSMDNLFDKGFLTPDEEIALAKRKDAGDRSAHDALIEHNMKLVLSIANKFICNQIELEDLIMEGVCGLNTAVVKFNWKRGYRFSTYATHWIRREIRQYVKKNTSMIRVPENTQKDIRDLAKTVNLSNEGQDVTSLAMLLEKSEDRTHILIAASNICTISLDQPHANHEDGIIMSDILVCPDPGPEELVIRRSLIEQARNILGANSRLFSVIQMRYGLDDYSPMTGEEVAQHFKVTRACVSLWEKRAFARIRAGLGHEQP